MGKKSRDKGYRVENELVNKLKENGFDAHRVPLSGGVAGYPGDIRINDKYLMEVKARKSGFKTIRDWMGDNDFIALKDDRKEPLVAMNWGKFVQLLLKAEENERK